MIKVTRLNAVTSWNRALNAARRTVGKSALKKELQTHGKQKCYWQNILLFVW